MATLDIIARGNFIFGIGLGYRDIEFDAFGVPKGERVKRFEEYLTLVQRLWTEDRVSYEGPGCRLENVHMNIRPVQKPRPPIWMAANNDPAVKRAARTADAWFINPHATIDSIRRLMAVYRAELKAAGKDAPRELPVVKEVYCAKDRATALEMAGPYLLAKYRDYAKWGQDKVMPDDTDFSRSLEELIEGRFILGSYCLHCRSLAECPTWLGICRGGSFRWRRLDKAHRQGHLRRGGGRRAGPLRLQHGAQGELHGPPA